MRAKGGHAELSLCHIQHIIDHQNEVIADVAGRLNLHPSTVTHLMFELGIRGQKRKRKTHEQMLQESKVKVKKDRPKPAQLARWNDYDPYWTAVALERHGYGKMNMAKVKEICGL